MESPERERPAAGIAMEFPASEGALSCSPPTMPSWLRRKLSEPKTPPPTTVEEIQAKLREADLRRQKFYESLSSKARPKPRSPSRSSSQEDDLGQRLEAKLLAAEEKRLSIKANAQMRLAKLDELRQAAKSQVEMRFKRERDELGTKVEMRVRQAEANRLRILRAHRQRRANLKERISQSLMRRMVRENKYKERVCALISQKRADAEKKRLGLLEAEKRRARARVLQVQKAANNINSQREMERSEMKNKLEERLQRARRNRAEYLKQRGRPYNAIYYNSWDTIYEDAEVLAVKLSRCWREFRRLRKTTADLAGAYNILNINESSVKSMPFEQFALLIQSSYTLNTTKALLERLETRFRISRSALNPSGAGDIDHLLKRVASPNKKGTPRKMASSKGGKRSSSVGKAAKTPAHLSRYQVRIVLCAYMIIGHPDAVISRRGERETALVKSAEMFVEEFELLIVILLNGPVQVPDEESNCVMLTHRTFRFQLAAFDSSWCSFLNSFVVWKAKDARSLEEDLVRAACRLELSMIQTCKMTPEGDNSGSLSHDMKAIQKQVFEDQKLLREKVLHLSGDAGIERMEDALSNTRTKFFEARENGDPITPLRPLMLSPTSPSFSSTGGSGKANNSSVASQKQSSVVRSLFRDEVDTSQISKGSLDMENLRIVNEYVHGEQPAWSDSSVAAGENQGDAMAKIKETMEKAFWDGIVESMKQDEPDYSRVVELMREVRDGICAMAPHSWRQEINESVDLEILSQVLNSGKLDIDYLGNILEYVLVTLRKLSTPAYEDELKKKHQQFIKDLAETCQVSTGQHSQNSQVIALIEGLRFVLEQIQDLKREISKARIRMLEPLLKGPEALYYLGKAFTTRFGQPLNALPTLPLTKKWLSTSWQVKDEEWNEHKSLLSELTKKNGSSPNYLPSTALRTGGSSLVKMTGAQSDISSSNSKATSYIETIDPHLECKGEEIDLLVRLGLLKLVSKIAGLTERELPETMSLNFIRLRSVQSQVQKIIVIATSLLVLRQTLVSQHVVSSQAQMDSILLDSFKRLSTCLDSSPNSGIADIIDVLVSSADQDNIGQLLDSAKVQPMKEIMSGMLSKSLQEDDPVFARVSQAVYLAMRGVVFGGTGKRGRELAEVALQKVGAGLLVYDVARAGAVLVVTAKVSVIVHGPWYANLTRE
ncbi:T-complex protein 11 [Striga asiatica]|uniref:T-complex protein 11 n=1 Tax=Striga asiatica TaxID=4170 RepID=A0A5A7RIJ3_STRAF|nr:T-complex protein 11 [Striga asiatica]